jgi:hypothetical protein
VQRLQERRLGSLPQLPCEEDLELSSLAAASLLDPKDDGAGREGYEYRSQQCSAGGERESNNAKEQNARRGRADRAGFSGTATQGGPAGCDRDGKAERAVGGRRGARERQARTARSCHLPDPLPPHVPRQAQGPPRHPALRAPAEQASRTWRRRWRPSATTRCSASAATT